MEIRCPSGCPHLRHERYQGERFLEPDHPWVRRYLRLHGEAPARLSALLFLDTSLARWFRQHPELTLAQVRRGLGHLRVQVSPIVVPQGILGELEARLGQEMEEYRKGSRAGSDTLAEAVEEAARFYESEMKGEPELRDYLRFASAFVAEGTEPEPAGKGEKGSGLILAPR